MYNTCTYSYIVCITHSICVNDEALVHTNVPLGLSSWDRNLQRTKKLNKKLKLKLYVGRVLLPCDPWVLTEKEKETGAELIKKN